MITGLYNNDVSLFFNARVSYKERNIFLIIVEGHVVAGSDGIVARFKDDEAAAKCLEEAGYTRDSVTENNIWHP